MVFRISKIHTNADFTFSNNKGKEICQRVLDTNSIALFSCQNTKIQLKSYRWNTFDTYIIRLKGEL